MKTKEEKKERENMVNIDSLHDFYSIDENNLLKIINEIYDRIENEGLKPIWISINPRSKSLERVEQLLRIDKINRSPLWGIPYAVKDNIDVKHFHTTCACPRFSKEKCEENAFVVDRLEEAGAILIGKTNLDQFATGLVGTRTPYGICSSVFNREYMSGGSSSGSSVSVAQGYVSFALGTDTAGSGRVPAMCNHIIGYKPTRGLLSARGVVAACRSLDCVSIFSETIRDAQLVGSIVCQFDAKDNYSRSFQIRSCPWIETSTFRFGIANEETLLFFNDQLNKQLFVNSIHSIETHLGGQSIPFDFSVFTRIAQLLYEGPWVNERYVSVGQFIDENNNDLDNVDPTVRSIISKAKNYSATQLFQSIYELELLKKQINELWKQFDLIIVPTAPTIYKIQDILDNPIELNRNLGYYTNFVNLLDLCGISIPVAIRTDDHLPFSITILSHAFTDNALFTLADRIHRLLARFISNSNRLVVSTPQLSTLDCGNSLVAVVGAHLSNQPLNYQLTQRNGRFVRKTQTKDCYRLFVLNSNEILKPGLIYSSDNEKGHSIEVEIWCLPSSEIGSFIQLISSPLCIGNIYLQDNSIVKGFLVESYAVENAQEISQFGGWINYLNSLI